MSRSTISHGLASINDPALAQPRSETERLNAPAQRVHDGRGLILAGFIIAVLGIIAYCVVGLSDPTGAGVANDRGGLITASLCIIGLGTLLWVIGSFRFLSGAMDSDGDTSPLEL